MQILSLVREESGLAKRIRSLWSAIYWVSQRLEGIESVCWLYGCKRVLWDSRTYPRRIFPRRTLPRQTFPRPETSPMDTFLTRHIPDGYFPNQTSPMDTSPTRHIPDRHLPDQTFPRPNARQIFSWVDASHNGHFPDQLNTSNNLKYLKKYIVRDNFGNKHAVVRTLEI